MILLLLGFVQEPPVGNRFFVQSGEGGRAEALA